jgi:hypothetical protein
MKLQKEIKISPKSEICEVKVAKSVKAGSFEVKIPIGDTFAYLYMDKKALKSLRGFF